MMAEASGLNSSVLVLNRHYMAVHVVNVRRAFGLLVNSLAEVIHIEDGQYANYDFDSWREVSEVTGIVQGTPAPRRLGAQRAIRNLRAARGAALALRSPAQAARAAQSAEHLRPRRQPVPVLRQAVRHQRAESRSHRAHLPRRRHELGEPRVRLREVQRPQRRPHAARGRHEAHPSARAAQEQSDSYRSSWAIPSTRAGRPSSTTRTGRWT